MYIYITLLSTILFTTVCHGMLKIDEKSAQPLTQQKYYVSIPTKLLLQKKYLGVTPKHNKKQKNKIPLKIAYYFVNDHYLRPVNALDIIVTQPNQEIETESYDENFNTAT